MAAMVPHSQHRGIKQSANILVDHCVHQHWEWSTMMDAVGHLGYNLSVDVVGLL
jgi:hypothetical protein